MLHVANQANTYNDHSLTHEERFDIEKRLHERDLEADLKTANDLMFEFNKKLYKLHPKARYAVLKLIQCF
jgi:hypothetical protein